jgi:hypothetical protein
MIHNFGWLIEGQLAGSGRPIHYDELIWLREQGISAIGLHLAPGAAGFRRRVRRPVAE